MYVCTTLLFHQKYHAPSRRLIASHGASCCYHMVEKREISHSLSAGQNAWYEGLVKAPDNVNGALAPYAAYGTRRRRRLQSHHSTHHATTTRLTHSRTKNNVQVKTKKQKASSPDKSTCHATSLQQNSNPSPSHLLRPRRPPRRVRRCGLSSRPGEDGVERDMGLRLSGYRRRRRSPSSASPLAAGEAARPLPPPPPPPESWSPGREEAVRTGMLKASLARRI